MIHLAKDGIFLYNDGKEKKVKSLIPFFAEDVKISKDFTLGDFFQLLENDKLMINLVFSTTMGGFDLQLYIDDIKQEETEDDSSVIKTIEISRVIEHYEMRYLSKDEKDKDDECDNFDMYSHVGGVGPPEKGSIEEEKGMEDCGYAIEFTRLSKLKNCKIVLNEDFIIRQHIIQKKGKDLLGEDTTSKTKTLFKTKKKFNLFDVIMSILDEISFMGDPKRRDEEFEEIKKLGKKIKELDVKSLSNEEFKKRLKKLDFEDMEELENE